MLKVINGKKDGFIGEHKIYIGRRSQYHPGSILQNKFKIGVDGTRAQVVTKYRRWLWDEFNKKGAVYKELMAISKRVANNEYLELVCWCKPKDCHGDIIKRCVIWVIENKL